MKLHCCHNLLQLKGTICFDSASQRLQPTVATFFLAELNWPVKQHTNNEDRK